MNYATILRDAANYIEVHGLEKRAFGGYGKPACMLGAVECVTHERMETEGKCYGLPLSIFDWPITQYMTLHLNGSVPEWNDASSRTKEEVVERLRAMADDAEKAEAP